MQVKPKNNSNQKVDHVRIKRGDKKDEAWDIKEEQRLRGGYKDGFEWLGGESTKTHLC